MRSLLRIDVVVKHNRRYSIQTRGKKDEWKRERLLDGSSQSPRNMAKRPEIMDASDNIFTRTLRATGRQHRGARNETSERTKVTQDRWEGFNPGIAERRRHRSRRKREECAADGHARENRFPKAITCKQSVNASKIHVSSLAEREAGPIPICFSSQADFHT